MMPYGLPTIQLLIRSSCIAKTAENLHAARTEDFDMPIPGRLAVAFHDKNSQSFRNSIVTVKKHFVILLSLSSVLGIFMPDGEYLAVQNKPKRKKIRVVL